PQYQPMMREIGLDADAVFTHPEIRIWRDITERQNCTLDATLSSGEQVRLHIKRTKSRGFHRPTRAGNDADREAAGIRLLETNGIPTTPLVGWGQVEDGRSFLITLDLAGYRAADAAVRAGLSLDRLIEPVAQ